MHSEGRETEVGSVCERKRLEKKRKKVDEKRGAPNESLSQFVGQIINKILNYLEFKHYIFFSSLINFLKITRIYIF